MNALERAAEVLAQHLEDAHTRDPQIVLPILEEEANDAIAHWANVPDPEVAVSATVADVYTSAVTLAELDIAGRAVVARIPETWRHVPKRHLWDARTESLTQGRFDVYKLTITAWQVIATKLEQQAAE